LNKPFLNSLTLLAILFIAGTTMAWAHHGSRISYDLDKKVTVEGVVTELDFVNPHVYFLFDVTEKDGKVTSWAAETLPPATFAARGWNKNTLKAGDKVVVTLFPSNTGAARGFLVKVTANGKVLYEDQAAPRE
jgi:hypothetical protein